MQRANMPINDDGAWTNTSNQQEHLAVHAHSTCPPSQTTAQFRHGLNILQGSTTDHVCALFV